MGHRRLGETDRQIQEREPSITYTKQITTALSRPGTGIPREPENQGGKHPRCCPADEDTLIAIVTELEANLIPVLAGDFIGNARNLTGSHHQAAG